MNITNNMIISNEEIDCKCVQKKFFDPQILNHNKVLLCKFICGEKCKKKCHTICSSCNKKLCLVCFKDNNCENCNNVFCENCLNNNILCYDCNVDIEENN